MGRFRQETRARGVVRPVAENVLAKLFWFFSILSSHNITFSMKYFRNIYTNSPLGHSVPTMLRIHYKVGRMLVRGIASSL